MIGDSEPEVGAQEASVPTSPATVGELNELISEMAMALSEAKAIPGSGRVLIDREQMLTVLELLADRLPDEMRQARWMVRERDTFIARTNEKAREVIEQARHRDRHKVRIREVAVAVGEGEAARFADQVDGLHRAGFKCSEVETLQ